MSDLSPIFDVLTPPSWKSATWIGEVNLDETTERVELADSTGYESARLVLRTQGVIVGFHAAPIKSGTVLLDQDALSLAVIPEGWSKESTSGCGISVVVCTYDRPALLRQCLRSLQNQTYQDLEILIVDNHPQSPDTAELVADLDDKRFRYLAEPSAGLSRARNVGLVAATYELVVFTDDDVVADPRWIARIASAFQRDPSIGCVSGIVLTGELRTYSQWYFDRRVDWSASLRVEEFRLATPPPDEPLFPFQIGRFGTGANFGVRRDLAISLGGFDEGLGAGTQCGSGEDSDMFFRILLAEKALRYDPSAIVWHRHRDDDDDLARQIENYGVGFGAWLTKSMMNPRVFAMFIRRVPRLVLKMRRYGNVASESEIETDSSYSKSERRGLLKGPPALLFMRYRGASGRPLRTRTRRYIAREQTYLSRPLRRT